jgi:hypothetical protein
MKNLFSFILSVFALVFTGASAEASKPCDQSPLSFTPYESVFVITTLPQEVYHVAFNPTYDAGYAQQFMHDVSPVCAKVWPIGHRYSDSYGTGYCSEGFDRLLLCHGQLQNYGHGDNKAGSSRGNHNEGLNTHSLKADLSRFNYLCPGEVPSSRSLRRCEKRKEATYKVRQSSCLATIRHRITYISDRVFTA